MNDYEAGPYEVCKRCTKHKGRHKQGPFFLVCPDARDLPCEASSSRRHNWQTKCVDCGAIDE